MNKLLSVIKYEFKTFAMNKAFIIITLIGPFLILALTILPSLLANSNVLASDSIISVYGASDTEIAILTQGLAPQKISIIVSKDKDISKNEVLHDKIDGLLEFNSNWYNEKNIQLYSKSNTNVMLYSSIEAILRNQARIIKAQELGLSPDIIQKINESPNVQVVNVLPDKEKISNDNDFMAVFITCLSFAMMIYMTVLLYGQSIGSNIVKEKQAKTVEILLSSVSPEQMMFGKILGIGLGALLQYFIWLGMALLGTSLLSPILNISIPSTLSLANLGWLVSFFFLGFFLYASGYAAIGSASEDQQHMSQLAWPLLIFLMIPLIMVSSLIMNPNSMVAIGLSFFPFTSPIVMFMRVVLGDIAFWEPFLAVVILIVTIFIVGKLSAKIFRIGILMTGKRFTLKELIKWINVK